MITSLLIIAGSIVLAFVTGAALTGMQSAAEHWAEHHGDRRTH